MRGVQSHSLSCLQSLGRVSSLEASTLNSPANTKGFDVYCGIQGQEGQERLKLGLGLGVRFAYAPSMRPRQLLIMCSLVQWLMLTSGAVRGALSWLSSPATTWGITVHQRRPLNPEPMLTAECSLEGGTVLVEQPCQHLGNHSWLAVHYNLHVAHVMQECMDRMGGMGRMRCVRRRMGGM